VPVLLLRHFIVVILMLAKESAVRGVQRTLHPAMEKQVRNGALPSKHRWLLSHPVSGEAVSTPGPLILNIYPPDP